MAQQYIQDTFTNDKFGAIRFINITDNSKIKDKINNLKYIDSLIQSIFIDEEYLKKPALEKISKFIKVDKFDDDKYYILLSIINYKKLILQLEEEKEKDNDTYGHIFKYLTELESSKPELFYKLIQLDCKSELDELDEKYTTGYYNEYNKVYVFIYLYDMFNNTIKSGTSDRKKCIDLLNNLIYNTTDREGKLRTDLTDFNYRKLFKPIVYHKNPPNFIEDLENSPGFGESSANGDVPASSTIANSLAAAQQTAQQKAAMREQERAESNARRLIESKKSENARRQKEANNVAALLAAQKQRESNRQRQAEEAQRQAEEAERQAEEAVTLATAEAEAKRLSEEEAKRKENDAKAEAKRKENEAKAEAKRIANETTIGDICNEVSSSANNGSAAPVSESANNELLPHPTNHAPVLGYIDYPAPSNNPPPVPQEAVSALAALTNPLITV